MNHLVAVEIKIAGAIVRNKITVTKEKFIDDDGHGVYRYILIYEGNCHKVYLGNRRKLFGAISLIIGLLK